MMDTRSPVKAVIAVTRNRLVVFGSAGLITISALLAARSLLTMLIVGFFAGVGLGASAMWLDHEDDRETAYTQGWADHDRQKYPPQMPSPVGSDFVDAPDLGFQTADVPQGEDPRGETTSP